MKPSAILGRLLFFHGDHQESGRYLKVSEDAASPDDAATQAVWRGTRARLLVAAGDARPATEMADSAVAIVSATRRITDASAASPSGVPSAGPSSEWYSRSMKR